jgi:hypothetical protein
VCCGGSGPMWSMLDMVGHWITAKVGPPTKSWSEPTF